MHLGLRLLRELISGRKLIWELAKADFRKRFVGSYFGIVWMFIQPVATVLVYFFVFQIGMKSTPPVPAPYVIWLIPGIIPWFFFSDSNKRSLLLLRSKRKQTGYRKGTSR